MPFGDLARGGSAHYGKREQSFRSGSSSEIRSHGVVCEQLTQDGPQLFTEKTLPTSMLAALLGYVMQNHRMGPAVRKCACALLRGMVSKLARKSTFHIQINHPGHSAASPVFRSITAQACLSKGSGWDKGCYFPLDLVLRDDIAPEILAMWNHEMTDPCQRGVRVTQSLLLSKVED